MYQGELFPGGTLDSCSNFFLWLQSIFMFVDVREPSFSELDVLMQQNAVVMPTVVSKKLKNRSGVMSRCSQSEHHPVHMFTCL